MPLLVSSIHAEATNLTRESSRRTVPSLFSGPLILLRDKLITTRLVGLLAAIPVPIAIDEVIKQGSLRLCYFDTLLRAAE